MTRGKATYDCPRLEAIQETRKNLSLTGPAKYLPGAVIAKTGYRGNKEGVDPSQLFFSNFPTHEKMGQGSILKRQLLHLELIF